ncbi:MAG: hypothetical protein AB4050_19730 [Synechococcus sp.]
MVVAIDNNVPSKKPRVVLYVSQERKTALEELAEEKGRTVSNMLNFWISKIMAGESVSKDD